MNRPLTLGLGVVLTTGWLGVSTMAQAPASKEQNVAAEKGKEGSASAISILNQAEELVQYARENESPVAMLAAVQMLQRVRVETAGGRVAEEKSGDVPRPQGAAAREKGKTPAPSLDPKTLLAEARGWAKGNQSLLGLLDAEAKKGPSGGGGTLGSAIGPVYQPGRASALKYTDWIVTMRGGEVARIAVIGDGDTDLDLEVFDENGNLIARDTDNTDKCLVEWTPKWTGKFRVRISNLGLVYNNYVLLSN
jgi:hypothetical protein